MDIFDKIDKFKYRYIILSINQFIGIQKRYDHIKKVKPPYPTAYCIIDWRTGEPLIYSSQNIRSKTFLLYKGNKKGIGTYDLSFLEPYKVHDKSFLLQSDKVSPRIHNIEYIYAIDHIWLAYVYKTKSDKLRMCINRNVFGYYGLIDSREMNLNEVLLSLSDGK